MAPPILLAVAGLATGALPLLPGSPGPASLLGAVLLGIVLAAYLRLHGGVRSSSSLACVALATVAAHVLRSFVPMVVLLLAYWTSVYGAWTIGLAAALGGAIGSATVAAVFLPLLPRQHERLFLEIGCCAVAGALLVGVHTISAAFPAVAATLRFDFWNGLVACALALVLYLRARPDRRGPTALRFGTGAGLAVVGILLVFTPRVQTAKAAAVSSVRVEPPYAGATRAATLASLREAPPLTELAEASATEPDMYEATPPSGFQCFPPPDARVATPDVQEVESSFLRLPPRRMHYLQCHPAEGFPSPTAMVVVAINEYPNEAWARYEMRFKRSDAGALQAQRDVQRTLKRGRPVFSVGPSRTYWASRNKIVEVAGTPPAALETFIAAYLKRHPNTLEPDFDLPYLPPVR